jgi:hypothetical protein
MEKADKRKRMQQSFKQSQNTEKVNVDSDVLWLHDLRDQTPKRNEVQTTDTNALLQF